MKNVGHRDHTHTQTADRAVSGRSKGKLLWLLAETHPALSPFLQFSHVEQTGKLPKNFPDTTTEGTHG